MEREKFMGDILHQKLRVQIEYNVRGENVKIDLEGDNGSYYAKLDKININPSIVDLNNFEIKKNSVKMDFKAPIVCNTDNLESSNSLILGLEFDGKDKEKFIEHIEEKAKSFGPEWEAAVKKRKQAIKDRLTKKQI